MSNVKKHYYGEVQQTQHGYRFLGWEADTPHFGQAFYEDIWQAVADGYAWAACDDDENS